MENYETLEISLEKIELVKDRTGVSYKEAKEALEKSGGNVVDAIISIEENINTQGETRSKASEIADQVKEVVRKGNVSKITIKKDDETVLNLPVTIGILGTVIFPWAALVGAVAALGTKCSIEIVKEDGSTVNVSEKATSAIDTAVSKGGVIFDEVRDKGGDFVNYAKEKGAEVAEFAKEKSAGAVEFAKEKGADVAEFAKEKAADIKWKAPENEAQGTDDFDLSDLDLSEMGDAEEAVAEAAEKAAEALDEAIDAVVDTAAEVGEKIADAVKTEE